MGDVVNLNKFRKQHKNNAAEKKATENRILFGRSNKEKKTDMLDSKKNNKSLSGQKLQKADDTTKDPKN